MMESVVWSASPGWWALIIFLIILSHVVIFILAKSKVERVFAYRKLIAELEKLEQQRKPFLIDIIKQHYALPDQQIDTVVNQIYQEEQVFYREMADVFIHRQASAVTVLPVKVKQLLQAYGRFFITKETDETNLNCDPQTEQALCLLYKRYMHLLNQATEPMPESAVIIEQLEQQSTQDTHKTLARNPLQKALATREKYQQDLNALAQQNKEIENLLNVLFLEYASTFSLNLDNRKEFALHEIAELLGHSTEVSAPAQTSTINAEQTGTADEHESAQTDSDKIDAEIEPEEINSDVASASSEIESTQANVDNDTHNLDLNDPAAWGLSAEESANSEDDVPIQQEESSDTKTSPVSDETPELDLNDPAAWGLSPSEDTNNDAENKEKD
ncbi:MAG: hypothetical protein Tsb005_18440 [Gammaproteobacteria bacterium]